MSLCRQNFKAKFNALYPFTLKKTVHYYPLNTVDMVTSNS